MMSLRRLMLILAFEFAVLCIGGVLDFIPDDYDFAVLIDDPATNYAFMKEVPLFSFVFGEEGLGLENLFMMMLSDTEEKSGIPKDVFLQSISEDFVIASKGISLDAQALTSLDINYYIDTLKNLGSNTILVMKSEHPQELLSFLAQMLGLELLKDERTYLLRDDEVTLFGAIENDYVVLSGGRNSVEKALASYKNGKHVFSSYDVFKTPGFVKGYFKGDSFKINMGMELKEDLKTDHFEVVIGVTGGKMTIRIKQYVKGNLDKPLSYITESEDMGDIPYIGNYFAALSSGSSRDSMRFVSAWFSGSEGDMKMMSEILSKILEGAKGKIYIVGDVSNATDITFAAVFNEDLQLKESIWDVLEKYGARRLKDDEWVMKIKESELYFFWYSNKFVVSNLSKDVYVKYCNRKRLKDDPAYQYLSKFVPDEGDISRAYLDLGDMLEKMTGLPVRSKMLFYQSYKRGMFTYVLEVM